MKKLNTRTAIVIFSIITSITNLYSQGYGEIKGLIKNTDLQIVPYATVKILQGNTLIGGAKSDENGYYVYKPLTPGIYDIVVIEEGHVTQPINKIKVVPNEATYVDVKLSPNTLGIVEITAAPIDYLPPVVDKRMYVITSVSGDELIKNAGVTRGDIAKIIPVLTSEAIEDNSGGFHMRGARTDASAYFVDGVRTLGATSIPGLCIENITVFSGGVPAMYGDVTSGVVLITTKSYFSGLREKNMRTTEILERKEYEHSLKKAKEDEEKRLKEIEEEKAQNKQG